MDAQRLLVEQQVQEMSGPLRELEALWEEGARRTERLQTLKTSEETSRQAVAELSAKRAALQEATGKLQEELRELAAKELPQVAKRQREAVLQVQRAQSAQADARSRWQSEVKMCQSALQAEEKQLARLLARKESAAIAAREGQQACSVLAKSLADVRLEHGRLLGWQQVLDEGGFRYFADSAKEQPEGDLPIGPGSKATAFASREASGEALKLQTDRPFGFALDLSPAAGRYQHICYFDAESAQELSPWMEAIQGWIAAAAWQAGDVVCVTSSFMSDSEIQIQLEAGLTGILVKVDEHEDAFVEFALHDARQWVFQKNRHKLRRVADSDAKDVFLDIVPQNDLIMHWALRVVGKKAARCYEFEADGVCMGKRTALDKGLPIKSQKLAGRTSKTHREITAWCTDFGAEHSYDAAGNNLFGGKNCQDFAVELCRYMEIDTEQLPFRQAEQVKTVLGAGAFVAADAALGTGLLAAGTGLVAGALDFGVAAAGAAAGAAMSPGVLAAAAAVGVGYASGVITPESIPGFGFETQQAPEPGKDAFRESWLRRKYTAEDASICLWVEVDGQESGLQLDIQRLKGEVCTTEANLRKVRAEEAASIEAGRLRTVLLSTEMTAHQVCSERLARLSRNMEDRTELLSRQYYLKGHRRIRVAGLGVGGEMLPKSLLNASSCQQLRSRAF
ncbi:unnamed protein product [Symbiodinium natans]|uniref:PH domain-containing protein n=1 Tax=Symbiodinium natans TaxID=878477 RepID=A0A812Q5Z1_9DINO|nr:unnamed protein product [Symbiodinium natans]